MEKTTKRRRGDRKDGVLLRNLDGMHFITPIIYPNRCDNEAYISETIDLGKAGRKDRIFLSDQVQQCYF